MVVPNSFRIAGCKQMYMPGDVASSPWSVGLLVTIRAAQTWTVLLFLLWVVSSNTTWCSKTGHRGRCFWKRRSGEDPSEPPPGGVWSAARHPRVSDV